MSDAHGPDPAAPEGGSVAAGGSEPGTESLRAQASAAREAAASESKPFTRDDVKWMSAILIVAVLGFAVWPYWPTGSDFWAKGDESTWLSGGENMTNMTAQMLGTGSAPPGSNFVVPFELLSVLLLTALIGAVAIALRERGDRRG